MLFIRDATTKEQFYCSFDDDAGVKVRLSLLMLEAKLVTLVYRSHLAHQLCIFHVDDMKKLRRKAQDGV